MFKLWAKKVKNNKIISDIVIEDPSADLSRTKKIFSALEAVCLEFDLSVPIWFDKNISEFKSSSRTRFLPDNFFDSADLDYLEISVIEED